MKQEYKIGDILYGEVRFPPRRCFFQIVNVGKKFYSIRRYLGKNHDPKWDTEKQRVSKETLNLNEYQWGGVDLKLWEGRKSTREQEEQE